MNWDCPSSLRKYGHPANGGDGIWSQYDMFLYFLLQLHSKYPIKFLTVLLVPL